MKRYIIATALAILAAFSCEKLPEDVKICGIGCREKVLELSWDATDCSAVILASGSFTASLPEDADWIAFKEAPGKRSFSGNGDCTLAFKVEINRSIPRSTEISLVCGTGSASITVNQDGLLEGGLDIEQKNILVVSEGGRNAAKISTRIAAEKFSFSTSYQESESTGWISGVKVAGNFIVFDVAPNLTDSLTRHADIAVNYPGGEGAVHVTQYSAGTDVEHIDIPTLKGMLAFSGSIRIDKHYILSGIVLNDDSEGNGAENRMISCDTPDFGYSSHILYVQDEAGTDGIKLIFNEDCKNVASAYDRISLDLYGLALTRESAPARYVIHDIPAAVITESARGEAPVANSRRISELSERDVYTYVKLEGVEIPIRKGPYVPIDIRLIDILPAYPMVLRDNTGNSIFMMVNSDCSWSRDGNAMPQGSGSVSGVLVAETCDNFEWDIIAEESIKDPGVISDYITGLGRIGDWQIRPVFHKDVELSEKFEDGFSGLLYEWRYCDSLGLHLLPNYDGDEKVLYPTWPAVSNPKTLKAKLSCIKDGENKDISVCNDFTHLGPLVGGAITRPENGNGVTDSLGRSAHWYVYPSTGSIGCIYSNFTLTGSDWSISNGAAWCTMAWSRNQEWRCEFSTSELSAANSPLSVQIGTFNHAGYFGAPRYWALEWSLDGDSWTRVTTYTVPDFPAAGTKRVYQMPGPKYMSFNLSDDLLGQDLVCLRLIPSTQGVGTDELYFKSGASYTATRYNALNYFAIRYNK